MRAAALVLGMVATGLSVMPALWMAILAVVQFGNLWMDQPYIREFPAIAAFWLGLVASMIFFGICVRKGIKQALSPFLLVPVVIGIAGSIAEDIMLLDNPKTSFPIGFFELASVSWLVAGVIAAKIGLPHSGDQHAA